MYQVYYLTEIGLIRHSPSLSMEILVVHISLITQETKKLSAIKLYNMFYHPLLNQIKNGTIYLFIWDQYNLSQIFLKQHRH